MQYDAPNCPNYCRRGESAGFVLNSFSSGVPEPSTWAMLLLGFGGVGFGAYRRTKKGSPAIVAA
jgi:hypothetical protein